MTISVSEEPSARSWDASLPSALERAPSTCDLSAVIACYNEEESIGTFHRRLAGALGSSGRSYELIFINDGSEDGTLGRLLEILQADPKVSAVVDLFSNSGQANATTPGIMLAQGAAILVMDSDLQLDPEELQELLAAYDAGHDIVTGYRRERHDSSLRRIPSVFANMIMRKASKTRLKDFGCTFKIYDANLVRSFELGPFKPWRPLPVIAAAGRIAEIPVSHHERQHGRSGWSFSKLFEYNMENVVNLSSNVFQYLGVACAILSLLFVIRIVVAFFVPGGFLSEAEVTVGLVLNFVVLGLLVTTAILTAIGEFVIRSFIALQRKPAFIVRKIHRRP